VINKDKPVEEVGDLPPVRLLIIANYNTEAIASSTSVADRLQHQLALIAFSDRLGKTHIPSIVGAGLGII